VSREYWNISKPAARSMGGVVVSQHYRASEAGAHILREGGNAVDAAIATSFAVSVVEPWMSGLGGGGVMISLAAGQKQATSSFFGMRSSRGVNPDHYPLSGGVGGDLFAWPAVLDDRNVHGPCSVAIPGQVAGMVRAHAAHGSLPWRELLQPAIELCLQGLEVDWLATVRIAAAAPVLARYPASAALYLPEGHTPAGQWGGPAPRLVNRTLATTLEQLARVGGTDFYRGDIARAIVEDARDLGIPLDADDLATYDTIESAALEIPYRGARVHTNDGPSGGPALDRVLTRLDRNGAPESLDADHFVSMAAALEEVFDQRVDRSESDAKDAACTSHISVVDRNGHAVALTQTLLSVFGSKVMLPRSGILMNNGLMWFDPRPGRPNAIAANQWPLCNMCPVVIAESSGRRIALGASGGRRIIGAVAQLCSWLVDFGMDADAAMEQARIDVSGTDFIQVDPRLPRSVNEALAARFDVRNAGSMVYPNLYGCPNLALYDPAHGAAGAAFTYSPVSAAVGG
jgi:gamma-glutamyltranspeptidase / glutathione hydrolase